MIRFLPYFIVLIFFLPTALPAQNPDLCIQVLGATGKSTKQNGRYYAYTVGEVVIHTLKGDQRTATQGFHQPDLCLPVATDDLNLEAWNIEVFPNPTEGPLNIRFDAQQSGLLLAAVSDLLGREIFGFRPVVPLTPLDCSMLQPGIYLLHLVDAETQAATAVKFVKL